MRYNPVRKKAREAWRACETEHRRCWGTAFASALCLAFSIAGFGLASLCRVSPGETECVPFPFFSAVWQDVYYAHKMRVRACGEAGRGARLDMKTRQVVY